MCTNPFKSKAPTPPPPPPPPERSSAEVMAAEEEERKRARLAKGKSSTIMTGGLGDTSQAPSFSKKLLGQ